MYLFLSDLNADSIEEGDKKTKPIVSKCRRFAKTIGSDIMYVPFYPVDGKMTFRITFIIVSPEDPVLEKVAALFSFAALLKLRLCNQLYFSE